MIVARAIEIVVVMHYSNNYAEDGRDEADTISTSSSRNNKYIRCGKCIEISMIIIPITPNLGLIYG